VTNYLRKTLESCFLEENLLTKGQIDNLLADSNLKTTGLARLAINHKLISEESVLDLIERHFNISQVNLYDYSFKREIICLVSPDTAQKYRVFPLGMDNNRLIMVMADPLDSTAISDLEMHTGYLIKPAAARLGAINQLITQFYSKGAGLNNDLTETDTSILNNSDENSRGLITEEAPIISMVDSLLERAIMEGASDIHLQPGTEGLRARFRIDGVLHELAMYPSAFRANIIARVKVIANLDIAEKRLPQDGNYLWTKNRSAVNMRISTMPTVNGEKAVIRILEQDNVLLPLDELGFSYNNYTMLKNLLLNQSGMVLVTGPTGCGKTSTLYSALNYLNKTTENIITVEDPVEYRLKGINQVQVNTKVNLTFARTLRSILRQDPNIIMVGEIRDPETARITVEAALTGHLVLSTLHTNSAAATVTRLVNMGLENYLVASSLAGVVAQRLIRKICVKCAVNYTPTEAEIYFCQYFFGRDAPHYLKQGKGCSYCHGSGYHGRTSIQEVMVLNQELQELIYRKATTEELHKKAVTLGMVALSDNGFQAVLAGVTTISEVVKTTFNSVLDSRLHDEVKTREYMETIYCD